MAAGHLASSEYPLPEPLPEPLQGAGAVDALPAYGHAWQEAVGVLWLPDVRKVLDDRLR